MIPICEWLPFTQYVNKYRHYLISRKIYIVLSLDVTFFFTKIQHILSIIFLIRKPMFNFINCSKITKQLKLNSLPYKPFPDAML